MSTFFFEIYSRVLIVHFFFLVWQDRKVHLNEWDGKTLKEIAVLEGNQTIVSALAFSPDGKLLASGDVSVYI
jgi:WD40 repeat protein